MTAHVYHKKLEKVLSRMGSLYTVQDILKAIAENKMQSFVEGDSWAITQTVQFPRAKVLEVLIAVGNLEECRRLHDRLLIFAMEIGAGVIQAYGRMGWLPDAEQRGWKVKARNFVYQRDM